VSDLLAAAAQAMGIPEPIAERSARARAEASGQSYEDVLTAWAGGEAVATAPPAEEPTAPAEEAPEPAEEGPAPEPTAAEPAPPAAPAQPEPTPAAAAGRAVPARPPVLEAPPDRPLVTVAGGVGVIILVLLLGVVFPTLGGPTDEVRTSEIAYSEAGQAGRNVYLRAGCASCHTQSVRAVVADVGAGPVALADTNQVVGFRRLGPDLSNVGTRLEPDQLRAVLTGGSHPAIPLSGSAIDSLVAYLSESAFPGSGGQGGGS
jgi:hypothetical protein